MWGKDRRGLESALHITEVRVSKIKWKIIRKSKIVQLMETGMLILAGLMQAGSEGKWREGKVRAREGGKGERRKGK